MKVHLNYILRHLFGRRVLMAWLPLAFLTTALCGFVYTAVQQNYRQSANDPQIQIATDFRTFFNAGQGFPIFNAGSEVQLNDSLAPFVEFFNASSTLVESSGFVGQDVPIPPPGIFDYVKVHGEERLTWEPRPGIRLASVVMSFTGPKTSGYIVAARSLREVEMREKQLSLMTLLAWLATLAGTLVLTALAVEVSRTSHV